MHHGAALLHLLPAVSYAHFALTIPQPREAVDANETFQYAQKPLHFPLGPCPHPSRAAAGRDDRNLTGSNGLACYWFSNGCAIGCDACDGSTAGPDPTFQCVEGQSPDSCDVVPTKNPGPKTPICRPQTPAPRAPGAAMNATICDPMLRTVNTAAKCGSPDDFYYYSPWRAPGYAPVIDSCGSAGGRLPGQGQGSMGDAYPNTTHAKLGDQGSKTLRARPTDVKWVAGAEYEVAWTILVNHGGGYSYRLCPAKSALDEDCFNRHPVTMVGQSALRWGGIGGRTLPFDAVTISKGTKAGITWRKNPVPMAWKTKDGRWGPGSWHLTTGMGFQPICEDDGVYTCTGQAGPYNLEVVDKILIPKDMHAGEWVLNLRVDSEESNQVWQSCSDVTVATASLMI